MTRFLIVPQWQGSPSARAMLLIDGAETIAGDLPRSACTPVEVPVEAGETLDTGIRRFSALSRVRDHLVEELGRSDEVALVIGGDCSVAVPAVAAAAATHPEVAVVWFDAHGDLHTPASSPSGAFAGMALRAVIDGSALGPASVAAGRVVLVGARDLDVAEADALATLPITSLTVDEATPEAVVAAVEATGADAVYVHIDLDVLDPAEIQGVADPLPFGMDRAGVTAVVAALRARFPLVGSSLTGFMPSRPDAAVDDMGTILRLVGSLA